MAKILFSDPQEFIDELTALNAANKIDHSFIRFTVISRPSGVEPISHLVAVATALVGSNLLRMEYPCGGLWASEDNPWAQERVARTHNEIEKCCRKLGLELHGGMYKRP